MINEIKKNFIKITVSELSEIEAYFRQEDADFQFNKIIEKSFFLFHSIKGTAPMLGYTNVGKLAGTIENFFRKIKEEKIEMSEEIVEISKRAIILIRSLIISDATPNESEVEEIKTIELLIEKFC